MTVSPSALIRRPLPHCGMNQLMRNINCRDTLSRHLHQSAWAPELPFSSPSSCGELITGDAETYSPTRGDNWSSRPKNSQEKNPEQTTASKSKRNRKEKCKHPKSYKLDKPLSKLTENFTHIPLVDIDAYVNRSAEERHKEVEQGKEPGKVKRPMNSFMLYRKAYQIRTKYWCSKNNHQVVSQVCGDSWPLEPESVKRMFADWAQIERNNHRKAHPDYKFSPNKPNSGKVARRKTSTILISDESDSGERSCKKYSPKRMRKCGNDGDESGSFSTEKSQMSFLGDQGHDSFSSQGFSCQPSPQQRLDDPFNLHDSHRFSYQETEQNKTLPASMNLNDMQFSRYQEQNLQDNPQFNSDFQDIAFGKTNLSHQRSTYNSMKNMQPAAFPDMHDPNSTASLSAFNFCSPLEPVNNMSDSDCYSGFDPHNPNYDYAWLPLSNNSFVGYGIHSLNNSELNSEFVDVKKLHNDDFINWNHKQ
ncbi:putative hmg box protein [Golovinomyces cichoracearum]|uniref:Putative hmg box protein n=1 Tax=Golovinomyces cichoracearum TaxID=62708 RepID=A0A420IDB7_9PEZI|nr:putative hmg box protein [Golovinomyces cichoracearum]